MKTSSPLMKVARMKGVLSVKIYTIEYGILEDISKHRLV
jgi:hypothetical protein